MLSIYQRLHRAFGPQRWWPADSALEVAVGAVLTQNAAWTSAERAIGRLRSRRMLGLASLARLSPAELAPLIRPAGLHRVKARRLHALVQWLAASGGFRRMRHRNTGSLREELLAVHGIGPETADSILLYALGRPVFVIDAYARRLLSRYGLVGGNEPYEDLRRCFETHLPTRPALYNEYHALIVRLGKEHCRVRPVCAGCPLV